MTHMNSNFYTFKNGNLYLHNLNNTRNNFYGQQEISTLSTIFNIEPTTTKKFKNIFLDTNHPWKATMHTNLDEGFVDYDWYEKKEGRWYAHIRRPFNNVDSSLLSTQGIGNILSYTSPTITFGFDIQVNLNQGDKVCMVPPNTSTLLDLGEVVSFTNNTITMTNITGAPSTGYTIVIVKNPIAESFGPRGYYLQVDFENDKNYEVTMFAVGASVFKSFP
jgi:hypothetical protein